jgi:hypothetical protein
MVNANSNRRPQLERRPHHREPGLRPGCELERARTGFSGVGMLRQAPWLVVAHVVPGDHLNQAGRIWT